MFAVLSSLVSECFFEKTNIPVLPLEPYQAFDSPVRTHADMLICKIEDTVFTYRDYYYNNVELFSKIEEKYKVIRIDGGKREYPNDIKLNVLVIGKGIYGRLDKVSDEVLDFAKSNGYTLTSVNQGYSACSTLVINEKSAITSDIGIYNALLKNGINSLFVTTEGIKLEGYNCGFIGGAGGVLGNTAYFFGDIKFHPDYEKIQEFLKEQNCTEISILGGGVYDFGGIKFL